MVKMGLATRFFVIVILTVIILGFSDAKKKKKGSKAMLRQKETNPINFIRFPRLLYDIVVFRVLILVSVWSGNGPLIVLHFGIISSAIFRLTVMRLIYGIATRIGFGEQISEALNGAFVPPGADDYDYNEGGFGLFDRDDDYDY